MITLQVTSPTSVSCAVKHSPSELVSTTTELPTPAWSLTSAASATTRRPRRPRSWATWRRGTRSLRWSAVVEEEGPPALHCLLLPPSRETLSTLARPRSLTALQEQNNTNTRTNCPPSQLCQPCRHLTFWKATTHLPCRTPLSEITRVGDPSQGATPRLTVILRLSRHHWPQWSTTPPTPPTSPSPSRPSTTPPPRSATRGTTTTTPPTTTTTTRGRCTPAPPPPPGDTRGTVWRSRAIYIIIDVWSSVWSEVWWWK